jgi:RimJ/RimL family protein N-acetyltransferase
MTITPVVLEGTHVRLEPLTADHVPALVRVGLDARIWEFSRTLLRNESDVARYVAAALEVQRAGTALPFATVDRRSQRVVGSNRFETIDVESQRTEIGWSWLNPDWWRTPINTEAKYLMLRHAFESWGCVRVEFKTLSRNRRSRDAVLRLGASEEGTLRRRIRDQDGSLSDVVYFSILDSEWPSVKGRLEQRLAR